MGDSEQAEVKFVDGLAAQMFCQHRFEAGRGESEQAEVKFVDGLTAQICKSVASDTARDSKRCKLAIKCQNTNL